MQTISFSDFNLRTELQEVLAELNFTELTPIQSESLPHLLAKKDLIGQAQTGSGKTAAFALPILNAVEIEKSDLQYLILCPTRELSTQVVTEIRKLGRKLKGLHVVALTGGQPGKEQREALANGAQIAVATPGRLADFLSKELVDLSQVRAVILDEADKMLDMGFVDEIKLIMRCLPDNRQTVFFSATFQESIQGLSKKYQRHAVSIQIESDEEQNITQIAYELEDKTNKLNTLLRILQQHICDSVIIFANMKSTVDAVTEHLQKLDAVAGALHGDFDQRERDRVLAMFRNRSIKILVATDVAARGLDIEKLDLVINYDLPISAETYVHRIGRTGRAGNSGIAVTMIDARDTLRLTAYEEITGGKFEKPPLGFKNQFGLSPEAKMAPMRTIVISGGRKDKLRPGDIVGALTGESSKLTAQEIGKIEVRDTLTYVGVKYSIADLAMDRLRLGKIKGKKYPAKLVK